MAYLDIAALGATPLKTEPYDYLVVPDFVRAERFPSVVADYPRRARARLAPAARSSTSTGISRGCSTS